MPESGIVNRIVTFYEGVLFQETRVWKQNYGNAKLIELVDFALDEINFYTWMWDHNRKCRHFYEDSSF